MFYLFFHAKFLLRLHFLQFQNKNIFCITILKTLKCDNNLVWIFTRQVLDFTICNLNNFALTTNLKLYFLDTLDKNGQTFIVYCLLLLFRKN